MKNDKVWYFRKIAKVKGAATVGEAYEIKDVLVDVCNFNYNEMKKFINTGSIDRYISLWGIKIQNISKIII